MNISQATRTRPRKYAPRMIIVGVGGSGTKFIEKFIAEVRRHFKRKPATIAAIIVDADVSSSTVQDAAFIELRILRHRELVNSVSQMAYLGLIANSDAMNEVIRRCQDDLLRSVGVHGNKRPAAVVPSMLMSDAAEQLRAQIAAAASEHLITETRPYFNVDSTAPYIVWVAGLSGGIGGGAMEIAALAARDAVPGAIHLAIVFRTEYDLAEREKERAMDNFGRAAVELAHLQNLQDGAEQRLIFPTGQPIVIGEPLFRQVFVFEQSAPGEPGANRMIAEAASSLARVISTEALRRTMLSIVVQNEIPEVVPIASGG